MLQALGNTRLFRRLRRLIKTFWFLTTSLVQNKSVDAGNAADRPERWFVLLKQLARQAARLFQRRSLIELQEIQIQLLQQRFSRAVTCWAWSKTTAFRPMKPPASLTSSCRCVEKPATVFIDRDKGTAPCRLVNSTLSWKSMRRQRRALPRPQSTQ